MVRIALLFILLLGSVPDLAEAGTVWSKAQAQQLLTIVGQIGSEGLDPADYDEQALRQDLASNDQTAWSERATAVFLDLAADLAQGHMRERQAVRWHIPGTSLDNAGSQRLLAQALGSSGLRRTLEQLVPQHRQYRLLKSALAATPARDKAGIERLRANLERWRWMPRELGNRYILVNVPAFTVSLVENGRVVERRRVVVGKTSTPTPQFAATVTGVIFNPWWEVPPNIVAESIGALLRTRPETARARGYVASGGRVRQAPGPLNALGQMKLVMPNPFTVYLHDTPSRNLFERDVRAFSHGCIRVEDPLGLGQALLSGTQGWSRPDIDRTVASGRTIQATLAHPVPVYVAYFTAAAEESGEIATFPDIYGRDGGVVSALIDRQTDLQP